MILFLLNSILPLPFFQLLDQNLRYSDLMQISHRLADHSHMSIHFRLRRDRGRVPDRMIGDDDERNDRNDYYRDGKS